MPFRSIFKSFAYCKFNLHFLKCTARSRKNETRSGHWNAKRSPNWNQVTTVPSLFSFENSSLKTDLERYFSDSDFVFHSDDHFGSHPSLLENGLYISLMTLRSSPRNRFLQWEGSFCFHPRARCFFHDRPARPAALQATQARWSSQFRGINPAQATHLWDLEAAVSEHAKGGDASSPSSACIAFRDWCTSAKRVLNSGFCCFVHNFEVWCLKSKSLPPSAFDIQGLCKSELSTWGPSCNFGNPYGSLIASPSWVREKHLFWAQRAYSKATRLFRSKQWKQCRLTTSREMILRVNLKQENLAKSVGVWPRVKAWYTEPRHSYFCWLIYFPYSSWKSQPKLERIFFKSAAFLYHVKMTITNRKQKFTLVVECVAHIFHNFYNEIKTSWVYIWIPN